MLSNSMLARINNRPRGVNRLPLLAAGGGIVILAALSFVLDIFPPFAALGILTGGALLVVMPYAGQKAKTTIKLSYKSNLDEETVLRFSEVQEVLERLVSSEVIWSLPTSFERPKAGEVEPTPEHKPATIGLLPTPGVKSDVPIWGIEASGGTLFFFPEGMLYYKNDRYEPVSYEALKMALSSGRFFEEGDLASDATVLETVWRYSRPDGSPDPRHKKDNAEIPVVLYNLIGIEGPSGLDLRLMVSNRKAAVRFARVFRAKDLREKRSTTETSSKEQGSHEEKSKSPEEIEREARIAMARKTLGVARGASAREISVAYRKLALAHHPDKVAGLKAEVREYSEERMKEINLAYAELKGQGGSVVQGARTV